jgi:hypothetical protein
MGKTMTKSERAFYEWLVKKYGSDVRYNYRESPDFVLPDGRMFEVKYLPPRAKTLYFTRKQWEELPNNVEIAVMSDDSEPLCIIPFSELKKKGKAVCGNKEIHVYVPLERTDVLQIRCFPETIIAFKKYAAEFKSYEDALISLLECKGIYVKRFEIK